MNSITLRLDNDSDEPLYGQLYRHIKEEITGGRYKPDTKLPSKRQLSAHLQCSLNTVRAAYGQLMSEGYVTARPKSGFYVSKIDGIFKIEAETKPPHEEAGSAHAFKYDFTHHGVDQKGFPFTAWRRILKDVMNEYDPDFLKTGNPQGDPALRSSIAGYLHDSRGVNCSPGQIIVSSGTEIIFLLLTQLFEAGCKFAFEDPGYEKLHMIFKNSRTPCAAIPLDESGMIPEALVESGAEVACVTPSHQFPMGSIMPVSRRIRLINWASEKPERYIIEDDYDSEFRYAGRPIPCMQGLDSGDKVIYIGAFSKSLTPAIRISYIVLPERLMQVYHEKLSFYICPVPIIEQKCMHRFIKGGHFERHLNRMRIIYKAKREALVAAVREFMPDVEIAGANAGLHVILRVSNGMREDELIAAAHGHGVNVYGISRYYRDSGATAAAGGERPAIMLGFAAIDSGLIRDAVKALRDAWL